MPENRVDAIRERLDDLAVDSPGPWTHRTWPPNEGPGSGEFEVSDANGDGVVGGMGTSAAVTVAANAPADLAYLLEDNQRLRGENARLETLAADYAGPQGLSPDETRATLAAARAEIARLDSWDGLLSILDEHYPAEVFGESSPDLGARIVVLTRHLAAARGREGRLRGYAVHKGNCVLMDREAWIAAGKPRIETLECSCGLTAALAREDGDGR